MIQQQKMTLKILLDALEDKEEKPDTRGMYAKIAMVKNKLRSKGISNPMVMMPTSPTKGQKLNMYGEENIQETPAGEITANRINQNKKREGEKAAETERTPANDDKSFSQKYKDDAKKAIEASKRKKIAGEFPGSVEEFDKKYGTGKVNPYGKGATANPENMSRSSGG